MVSSLKDSKESPRAWNGGKAKRYRITLIIPFSQRREERLTETERGARLDHFNSICKREQRWRTLPCWQPFVLLMSSAVWRMTQAWRMSWIQPYTSAHSVTYKHPGPQRGRHLEVRLSSLPILCNTWLVDLQHEASVCLVSDVQSSEACDLVIMCYKQTISTGPCFAFIYHDLISRVHIKALNIS